MLRPLPLIHDADLEASVRRGGAPFRHGGTATVGPADPTLR